MPTQIYDIKEPDYDDGWFKFRANQALLTFEHRKNRTSREILLNVLTGLYRHAYNKGRHDEKRDQAKRGIDG